MTFAEAKKALGGMIAWQRSLHFMQDVLDTAMQAETTTREAEKKLSGLKADIPVLEQQKQTLIQAKEKIQEEFDKKRMDAEAALIKSYEAQKMALQNELEAFKSGLDREASEIVKRLESLKTEIKKTEENREQVDLQARQAEQRLSEALKAFEEFKTKL